MSPTQQAIYDLFMQTSVSETMVRLTGGAAALAFYGIAVLQSAVEYVGGCR